MRVPAKVRVLVLDRDNNKCVRCYQHVRVAHIQHRIPRGMGGSRDPASFRLSNLLTFCWRCNLVAVERERTEALDNGWVVSQWADPSTVAVKYRGKWAMLDDDGGVTYCER